MEKSSMVRENYFSQPQKKEVPQYSLPYTIQTKKKSIISGIAIAIIFILIMSVQYWSRPYLPSNIIFVIYGIILLLLAVGVVYGQTRMLVIAEEGIYYSSIFSRYFLPYDAIQSISYTKVVSRGATTYYINLNAGHFSKKFAFYFVNLQSQRILIDAALVRNDAIQLDDNARVLHDTGTFSYLAVPMAHWEITFLIAVLIGFLVIFVLALLVTAIIHQPTTTSPVAPTSSLWKGTTTLPEKVIWSSSVAANGYLYSIGGFSPDSHKSIDTVYMSRINPDGSLSPWQTTTPLPFNLSKSGAFVFNGSIFVIGGENIQSTTSDETYKTVLLAHINDDGTLGTWEYEPSLPKYISQTSFTLDGNNLYVIGCSSCSKGYRGEIFRTAIIDNNGLYPWTTYTTVPGLTNIQLFSYSHRIYAIGHTESDTLDGIDNLTNASTERDIYEINSNQFATGQWTLAGELPQPLTANVSVVQIGDTIYIRGDTTAATDMYAGTIESDGSISDWRGFQSGEQLRKSAVFLFYNNYLYLIGGRSLYTEDTNASDGYRDVNYLSLANL